MELDPIKKKGLGRRSPFQVTYEMLIEVQLLIRYGLTQKEVVRFYGFNFSSWSKKLRNVPQLREVCDNGLRQKIFYKAIKLRELKKQDKLKITNYSKKII